MINERVARINGAFTVFLLLVSGLTSSIIPVVFLAIDFFLRSSDLSGYRQFSDYVPPAIYILMFTAYCIR